ncbi:MAG: peptidoglycan binding domain-containing protein [Eubacteriales bacterium]|nr:peptidoglycan binding domain-containing protein [Eubacteriales bacterium]
MSINKIEGKQNKKASPYTSSKIRPIRPEPEEIQVVTFDKKEKTARSQGDMVRANSVRQKRYSAQPKKGQGKTARPTKYRHVELEDDEFIIPDILSNAENEEPKTKGKKVKKPQASSTKNARKKHKATRILGMVAAIALVMAGTAYAGVAYYFSDKFIDGTYINGVDCSRMTAYEVEERIANEMQGYSIDVLSRNQAPQNISGASINYQYVSDGEVLNLLKNQKSYLWIRSLWEPTVYTTTKHSTYDKTLLQSQVKALNCAQSANQVKPENAYISYTDNQFEIIPETEGSELDLKEALKALENAINNDSSTIDFNEEADVYEKASITRDSQELQLMLDAYNNFAKASVTYTFGDETVVLDGKTISNWLQVGNDGQLTKDDEMFTKKITEFVGKLAKKYDTVGTEREFQATDGRTVYVMGSAYGWQIDQAAEVEELKKNIQEGVTVTREPVYALRANSHGVNDFGDTYIEVDLGNQEMYYYQNGSIIMQSPFVSGSMNYGDRQTPSGVYTLYFKKSPDVLRGDQKPDGSYTYEQAVTYWMPFNGGVGFHDATWRDEFGGSIYLYSGSHGCINLPTWAAAQLYELIDYNVPIICFY